MTSLENNKVENLSTLEDQTELQTLTPENFGTYLKQKRNEKGESLEEINKKIHINTRVLKAFEQNHFTNIEDFDNVYLRMYLKKYADYLGIDDYSLIDKQIFEDTAKQVNRAAKLVPEAGIEAKRSASSSLRNSHLNSSFNTPSRARKLFFLVLSLLILIVIGAVVVKSVFVDNQLSNPTPVVVESNNAQVTQEQSNQELAPTANPNNTEGTASDTTTASTAEETVAEPVVVAEPTELIAEDGTAVPLKGVYIKLSADSWIGVKTSSSQSSWGELKVPLDTLFEVDTKYTDLRIGNVKGVKYLYINGVKQELPTARNITNVKLK
ncbi:hypothetical protein CKF54_00795 [Psittacicella hinzii]|uniref:Helix-turn-helix domain-containing protein n=1 Tax=Psittacicella hinzii TaxID=2028575 RepID=A0A3A1YAS6_9GAMM|nr:helix-turn-helix transcriptional regulator [Psittacicella hinzii]RIY34310.1 hypothetical protein CKF54_00795 [Psittacicella hinzii]